jgi:hypothetical protein
LPQGFRAAGDGGGQRRLVGGHGIAGDVVEAPVAGGAGDQDEDLVGTLHLQAAVACDELAAARDNLQPALERQPAGDALHRRAGARHPQRVATFAAAALLVRGGQRDVGADPLRLVGGQAHDDERVGRRRVDLTNQRRAAGAKARLRDGLVEVQAALVATHAVQPGEDQQQLGQRLVAHLLHGLAEQRLVGQLLGLGVAAGEHQFAHLGQALARPRVGRVVRAAGEEAALVELQPLGVRAAEDHGAQAPVTDRQRLRPFIGGAAVPEAVGLRLGRRLCESGGQGQQRCAIAQQAGLHELLLQPGAARGGHGSW